MHTYKYLYNKEKTELPSMDEGLKARILAAKAVLREIHDQPLKSRDEKRLNAVLAAIRHNQQLLEGDL